MNVINHHRQMMARETCSKKALRIVFLPRTKQFLPEEALLKSNRKRTLFFSMSLF
jgi:hypothetical protein